MIYTDYKNLKQYYGLHPNMDVAITYLLENDIFKIKPGRNEVDKDKVFINQFDYKTISKEKGNFEAHYKYADIHLILDGCEYIGVSSMEDLCIIKEDKKEDSLCCKGKIENLLLMKPGKVLIVFPEDAHMVKLKNISESKVKKAVVKVKVR